jgi:hypothetical protein
MSKGRHPVSKGIPDKGSCRAYKKRGYIVSMHPLFL